jgi:dihydroorotase (multifunctional complex type)
VPTHDLMLVNGQVVLPSGIEPADLLIDDGRISGILRSARSRGETASEIIDAAQCIIVPGLVDPHVHFRDPGYPQKEDFASGSAAAAAGGVTTIVDMPNTNPPTTTPERLSEKMERAKANCRVAFAFHGGPPRAAQAASSTGTPAAQPPAVDLAAAKRMQKAGVASFKIYMPHNEGYCASPLASLGLPLTIHAEEPALISEPTDGTLDSFLKCRPSTAESQAIEQLLRLLPRASIHICHVSTAEGLKQILAAQRRGVPVTCEVTPHHLLLTVKDLKRIGPLAKCYPPLRQKADAEALTAACLKGKITLIASDHAPHTDAEKAGRDADFKTAPAGIIGVETAFPLLHTFFVRKMGMPLLQLIQLMAQRPAERFRLTNLQGVSKGQVAVGADADLVVFDPKAAYVIRGDALHGKPRLTPYEGRKVTGRIRRTLLRGVSVYEEES